MSDDPPLDSSIEIDELPAISKTILPFTASQIRKGLTNCQILGPCRMIMGYEVTDDELNSIDDETLDLVQRIMVYEKDENDYDDLSDKFLPVRDKIRKQINNIEETLVIRKTTWAWHMKEHNVYMNGLRLKQAELDQATRDLMAAVGSRWIKSLKSSRL